TFGCKVNTYDTGLLQARLQAQGYLPSGDLAPRIHILNTCAVTQEATKEAVKEVRRIKAKNPFATVVVTGCAAQVDLPFFKDLPGADLVIANSHKGDLEEILKKYFRGELKERVFHSNIFRKNDVEPGGGEESTHTRSFLKIQDGCNSFCTYCVIPFARGKSRSISVKDLAARIRRLEVSGVKEVVLTGVHIGDYECPETKAGLEGLVEELLALTKMPRFRLSSLEPVEVTERLLDLYSDDRMCPHFHMSIQSAETEVLKDMKRKYTEEDVERSLLRIQERVPGAYVGMDVIVGFPTETEERFLATYERLSRLPWTRIHVFPYSVRPGTKAQQLLPTEVKNKDLHDRARRLRELSFQREKSEAQKQIGALKQVLVLAKAAKGGSQGLSRDYWPMKFSEETANESAALSNQEVWMKVTAAGDSGLTGMRV
ncbi:MAG: tRNA (N(6)-L-threonylcarbamoyladenosine(37)-C(2))-methylthiotransferase MtaB, partial [Bdellovibrionales bacterium]|nr:tRNA (N(6)-L-threonylcarbamoyladenosine(37)-C(2))-methylthiotransferase MtaB [Bdellovibrionales bacterium]